MALRCTQFWELLSAGGSVLGSPNYLSGTVPTPWASLHALPLPGKDLSEVCVPSIRARSLTHRAGALCGRKACPQRFWPPLLFALCVGKVPGWGQAPQDAGGGGGSPTSGKRRFFLVSPLLEACEQEFQEASAFLSSWQEAPPKRKESWGPLKDKGAGGRYVCSRERAREPEEGHPPAAEGAAPGSLRTSH